MKESTKKKTIDVKDDESIIASKEDFNLFRIIINKQREMKRRNEFIKNLRCARCNSKIAIIETEDNYVKFQCINQLCRKYVCYTYEDMIK